MLCGLPGVTETEITTRALCFVDTAGAGLRETFVGVSKGNEGLNLHYVYVTLTLKNIM